MQQRHPCPRARDINIAVVRVAAERVASTLQLLVKLGEQDVGQQRRQYATDTKGKFEFEREVRLDRSVSVLDLRRKR